MVYDCFTFFNEIDLLEIRLALLDQYVDYFVIAEADRTFTNVYKGYILDENKERYSKYWHKIKYVKVSNMPDGNNAWDCEKFQRDCLAEALSEVHDEDLIVVSDIDELYDPSILRRDIVEPTRIQMNFYYYFFNWKSNEVWDLAFISKYRYIKHRSFDVLRSKKTEIEASIPLSESGNSMHVSYLFGYDIEKYQYKLASFSHQEYNKKPYNTIGHIKFCLNHGIDIFVRKTVQFRIQENLLFSDLRKVLPENNLLKNCIYMNDERSLSKYEDYFQFVQIITAIKGYQNNILCRMLYRMKYFIFVHFGYKKMLFIND